MVSALHPGSFGCLGVSASPPSPNDSAEADTPLPLRSVELEFLEPGRTGLPGTICNSHSGSKNPSTSAGVGCRASAQVPGLGEQRMLPVFPWSGTSRPSRGAIGTESHCFSCTTRTLCKKGHRLPHLHLCGAQRLVEIRNPHARTEGKFRSKASAGKEQKR